MFQSCYKIKSMEQLNPTTYRLILDCAELAEESWCGRFVNIRCGEKPLRRPISICEIDKANGTITLVFEVRGEGTEWLAARKADDELDVLGPLGNGFFPNQEKRAIFIGGGIGCPPMLGAAQAYGANAEAILGFRSAAQVILLDDFKGCCQSVEVTTNDGSYGVKGFVTDVLKDKLSENPDCVVYACGPQRRCRYVRTKGRTVLRFFGAAHGLRRRSVFGLCLQDTRSRRRPYAPRVQKRSCIQREGG